MPSCECVSRTALEIALKVLRLLNCFKRHVQLDLPGSELLSVWAFPGVVISESMPKICGVADVTPVRITQALDYVGIKHGLPSIAWNPVRGKSSFAKAMEDILRLKRSCSSDSKRRMVESVGNAPTSTCLQGRCIACLPRPRKLARRPGAAPGERSFGDSAAQAGARRMR